MRIDTKFNVGDKVEYIHDDAITTGTITDIKADVMTTHIPESVRNIVKEGEPLIQYCIDNKYWIMELVDYPRLPQLAQSKDNSLCSHCDNTGCAAFPKGGYTKCDDFDELLTE